MTDTVLELHDLVDPKRVVTITQGKVRITKVGFQEAADCLFRSPEVLALISQGDVTIIELLRSAPRVAAELICISMCGDPLSEKDMKFVSCIVPGDQHMLLKQISEISFPNGMQSFLDDLRGGYLNGSQEPSGQSVNDLLRTNSPLPDVMEATEDPEDALLSR